MRKRAVTAGASMPVNFTRSPLVVMRRVLHALMLREVMTRFGSYRLGALWLILDPLIQVGVMVALFAGILNRVMPNVEYAIYLATGIVPWLMFGDIVNRGMASVNANKGLFSFRQVRPLDAFLARVFLEFFIYSLVFVIVLVVLMLVGYKVRMDRPLEFLLSYLSVAALATAISLLMMSLQAFVPEVRKAVGVSLRFLYLISGVILPMSVVPWEYRQYFMWNPLLHAMELGREAFFPAFHAVDASWSYLWFCVSVLALAASLAYRVSVKRMLS